MDSTGSEFPAPGIAWSTPVWTWLVDGMRSAAVWGSVETGVVVIAEEELRSG
jgi:hypothetical protein